MTSPWLVAQALVLELAGLAGLLSGLPGWAQLGGYIVAHGIACIVLSTVLVRLLPERYRGQPRRTLAFLFTLQFAIPFLGSLGVALGVLLALYLPRSERELPWQEISIPELPFRPIDMDLQMIYSEGGLRQVLRDASDPDKRLKALIATRQMNNREAIGILQEALKDKVDDVRLLAYSMLEQKEKALTQRASRLQESLKHASEGHSINIRRRLAQIWWEMAYLGLAQGGLRTHYLENARKQLTQLVARRPQHNDFRLLGRVTLELGDLETARAAFERALEHEAPDDVIRPYLAEVAFLQRNFQEVRQQLSHCSPQSSNPGIRVLTGAWL